jgi:hypothetical protein
MRTVQYSSPGSKTHPLNDSAAFETLAGNPAIAGCLIAGALITVWLTCFFWPVQTPSLRANVAPVHASSEMYSAQSNVILKGNRLDRANATGDRTFPGQSKIEIVNSNRKVPIGCEVAFSRLVVKDNVPVRCLT